MTKRTFALALSIVSIAAAGGCSTPRTHRVAPSGPVAAPARAYTPAAPRPQVMIGTTGVPDAPPQQTLVPTNPLSEEERSELLREAGSPIRPYTPAPFQPTRTVVQYVSDGSYETVYHQPSGWDRARPWVEAGMWTAFLTAPFFMFGCD